MGNESSTDPERFEIAYVFTVESLQSFEAFDKLKKALGDHVPPVLFGGSYIRVSRFPCPNFELVH